MARDFCIFNKMLLLPRHSAFIHEGKRGRRLFGVRGRVVLGVGLCLREIFHIREVVYALVVLLLESKDLCETFKMGEP